MLGTILFFAIPALLAALIWVAVKFDSKAATGASLIVGFIVFIFFLIWFISALSSVDVVNDNYNLQAEIANAKSIGITTNAELLFLFGERVNTHNRTLRAAQYWNQKFDWWYSDRVDEIEPISLLENRAGVTWGHLFQSVPDTTTAWSHWGHIR